MKKKEENKKKKEIRNKKKEEKMKKKKTKKNKNKDLYDSSYYAKKVVEIFENKVCRCTDHKYYGIKYKSHL